jgi:hypothetical protein
MILHVPLPSIPVIKDTSLLIANTYIYFSNLGKILIIFIE